MLAYAVFGLAASFEETRLKNKIVLTVALIVSAVPLLGGLFFRDVFNVRYVFKMQLGNGKIPREQKQCSLSESQREIGDVG